MNLQSYPVTSSFLDSTLTNSASKRRPVLSRRDTRTPARLRLQESEWFDDLLLLHELDRRGRVRGAFVCELDEALDYIRGMNSDDAFDP